MRFVKIVMGEELNLMNNIERIIAFHLDPDRPYEDMADNEVSKHRIDVFAKAIKQYVIKARIEELEKFRYNEDKEWLDTNVVYPERINNKVDERIAELKKGLNMANRTTFRYGETVEVIDGFYQGLTGILIKYYEDYNDFSIELFKKYDSDDEVFVCKAIIRYEDLRKINEK